MDIAHGHVILDWNQDIISIESKGPFNLEGIKHATQDFKNAVVDKNIPYWKRVDIADEHTLGSPSVMNKFARTYVWSFENGCQALAIIYVNIIQKALCTLFIKTHNYNIKLFDNEKDALEWLKSIK